MTRLAVGVIVGVLVGVLVNQRLWVRRIRRTLEPMPESGTVTEHDGTSWTWTA